MRLRTHLKNIHKFLNAEITRRENEARSNYWNSAGTKINSIVGITESDTPSISREKLTPNDLKAHLLDRNYTPNSESNSKNRTTQSCTQPE